MSILSSLFGSSKPKTNYSKIVSNIASIGGKGILQIKYEDVARHFQDNAKVIQATPDMINAEYETDNNHYLVFLERERSGGRDTGRTVVSVSARTPIDWSNPKIGDALTYAYNPFINARSDAEDVVHTIYMHGQSQFIYDTNAGGKLKQGAASSAIVPASLKSFIGKFPDDHRYKVDHDVVMLTEQITRDAGETELQIQVIYSIADAIVREQRLLS